MTSIIVHVETTQDIPLIHQVEVAAFNRFTEAVLVDLLRQHDHCVLINCRHPWIGEVRP